MLHLAAVAFMQGAVCVVMGENLPSYPFFPSVIGEGNTLFPVTSAAGPSILNTQTNFGAGLLKDGLGDKSLSFPNSPSASSNPSELSFSKSSSQKDRKGPFVMEHFAENFMKKVKSSNKLHEAFQVRGFNAESLSHLYYNYVFKAHSSVGALDAPVSARIVSEAVSVNFDKLKEKDAFLRIYADAAADYLFFRGYLNPSNVESLSQEYFAFTEKCINSIRIPSPEANIRAVADGFNYFLSSLGLVNPYSTVMVAGVFSSRFYFL